jgi:hypothetical protein
MTIEQDAPRRAADRHARPPIAFDRQSHDALGEKDNDAGHR